ncbi:MAG: hypothetical protein ACI395_00600, partial [Candidatus Cryptobacteroides sp.]
MKKRIIIFFAFLAAFALCSCERENLREGTVGDSIVPVDIEFGSSRSGNVEITTKATLGIVPESRVSNMFLFIFVDGKRYYAHYFDSADLVGSIEELKESWENCWIVDQQTSESDEPTQGTMHLFAPILTGGTLYAIANIDADMVNISPEKVNVITTEAQLLALSAQLNQEITSRNGLFPMTGKLENVTVSQTGIKVGSETAKVYLERLDAKVNVNVRVASGYESISSEGEGEGTVTTTQKLKEFRPESWRVVNVPKGSYVFPKAEDVNSGFFSTTEVAFETTETKTFTIEGTSFTSDVHGFSFYMLENREASKASTGGNYHLRDLRVKDPGTGEYALDASGEKWVYAPENGTYLEVRGEVVMEVDVSSEAKQQQLAADVVYYIHLGDLSASMDNYDISRNTSYTYNITIKGVSNIELEVETSRGNL